LILVKITEVHSDEVKSTARPVTPLGIVVQQVEQLQNAAKSESISSEFATSLKHICTLAGGIDPYLENCTTPESVALANLAQKTQREDWSKRFSDGETVRALEQEMLSGHIEGQLLKMLVAISKSKRVLEIGIFSGYSALAIAEALPDYGCLIATNLGSRQNSVQLVISALANSQPPFPAQFRMSA
jgi:caffeoyl-CoA O-methyltransferase